VTLNEREVDLLSFFQWNEFTIAPHMGFSTPARIFINENVTKKNFEIYRVAR